MGERSSRGLTASAAAALVVAVLSAACSSGPAPATICPVAPSLVSSAVVAGPPNDPGICVRDVMTSFLPGAQRLNVHPVGEKLQFTVPPGTASLSIVSQAISAADTISLFGGSLVIANTVVPTLLTSPNGLLYDDLNAIFPADPASAGLQVYYATQSAWTGTMTIPNTSAMIQATAGGLPAGAWSLEVNDYAFECPSLPSLGCSVGSAGGADGGTYDITVLTKSGPIPATGRLDVAFYLVTQDLTAATAPSDPAVQRMVSTLGTLLAGGGVCLGTATFHDVPTWAKAKYARVDGDSGSCKPLAQMFTLSLPGTALQPENTLNFFLVDEIVSTSLPGFTTVGQDGTIPGPSTVGGTVASGAAVSVADLHHGACGGATDLASCGADVTAYIAAHEAGHWLGLYHTTEATGDLFDPLGDTLGCDCLGCAPSPATCASSFFPPSSPHVMQVSECTKGFLWGCGGGDNLMFWLLDPSRSSGALSPEQGEVMRSNPAVQ